MRQTGTARHSPAQPGAPRRHRLGSSTAGTAVLRLPPRPRPDFLNFTRMGPASVTDRETPACSGAGLSPISSSAPSPASLFFPPGQEEPKWRVRLALCLRASREAGRALTPEGSFHLSHVAAVSPRICVSQVRGLPDPSQGFVHVTFPAPDQSCLFLGALYSQHRF